MIHLALFEPEIPPNTGNVIRLAANTGFSLHLVRPLGFELDDRKLRRAGLDYREYAAVSVHDSYRDLLNNVEPTCIYLFTTKASRPHTEPEYQPGDLLVFGPETRGLPDSILESVVPGQRLRIPMRQGSRSLNLSNSVAVASYEVWRQLHFAGGI